MVVEPVGTPYNPEPYFVEKRGLIRKSYGAGQMNLGGGSPKDSRPPSKNEGSVQWGIGME